MWPTYESFLWCFLNVKKIIYRLIKDLFISVLRYAFPQQLPLPRHIVELLSLHNQLKAERETNTVTYIRHKIINQPWNKIKQENSTQAGLIEVSDTILDALMSSLPGSQSSIVIQAELSPQTLENVDENLKQALDFLHRDEEFFNAAELGDEITLQRLLKSQELNRNQKDHLGRNALHLAVGTGNRHAVLVLLKAGIDPNLKDKLGMTPLSICIMRRPTWRMVNLLFDYGAAITPRSNPMDTGLFLQFAIMCIPTKEEIKILRLLVEKGALINDPGAPGGRQAMHFAAMSNNLLLLKVLFSLGADLFVINHRRETPRQVAATFKCKEAQKLLEEWEDFYVADRRTLSVLPL